MGYIKYLFKDLLAEYGISGNIYIIVAIFSFIITGIIMRNSNFKYGKLGGLLLWMIVSVVISSLIIIILSIISFIKENLLIVAIILFALLLLCFTVWIVRKKTIIKY